jgi:hypothetical protein
MKKLLAAALANAVVLAPSTAAPAGGPFDRDDRKVLLQYARDTYRSMEAMVEPATGLVDDNIEGSLDPATRGGYTSPTNIGAWLWSTVVARELRFISRREALDRMALTLETLAQLERHPQSGMFYNWYDPATLEKLRVWPADGSTVYPFLSSVDNGWLAAALMVVRSAEPRLRREAEALLYSMDFGFFYDPVAKGPDVPAGLMRGGFWDEPPPGCGVLGNYRGGGADVWYTCHHYGALNSETRAISYIAIALGQVPPAHYFAIWRTFPPTCDWSWQEQLPVGEWEEHLGVPVFQGAYQYRGVQLVPSFGGDMFEVLMPDLFVPEAKWAPTSWGRNHPLHVWAQVEHGMVEADYGYWGFSPASDPLGGYREYGVEVIGMSTDGYPSDVERTNVDIGFGDCRPAQPMPDFGEGVVTPHAAFLALPYAPEAAMANLANIKADFDAYGPGGFYDAIAVDTGRVARRHLSLDQGMIMGALGNVLAHDVLHRTFTRGEVRRTLPRLLGIEEFNASRAVPPFASS